MLSGVPKVREGCDAFYGEDVCVIYASQLKRLT